MKRVLRKIEIGAKYARLTIVEELPKRHVKCICECGSYWTGPFFALFRANTRSCGCLFREERKKAKVHGCARDSGHSLEYKCWVSMNQRCHNPNSAGFRLYGGRGITVCEAWRKDFVKFLKDVGPRPGKEYSLDRIDNSKGYFPGNVRWATMHVQNRNRRGNKFYRYKDFNLTAVDWALRVGMKLPTLSARLRRGMPIEEALTLPVIKGRPR